MSKKHPIHRWEFRQPIPTHGLFKDLTGQPFGRLWVLGYAGKKGDKHHWWCRCSCRDDKMIIVKVSISNLSSGHTLSCECLQKELTSARFKKHGKSKTPEYHVWIGMIKRCYNKKDSRYMDYGGRGIRVCKRWRGKDGLKNFLSDMGKRPGPGYEIDRKDNDGDYTPENCHWVTAKKNMRNKRNNHVLTLNGKSRTLARWSEKTGILANTLLTRKKLGWSDEETLNTPIGEARPSRRPERDQRHSARRTPVGHFLTRKAR